MNRSKTLPRFAPVTVLGSLLLAVLLLPTVLIADDDALEQRASWQPLDAAEMAQSLRSSLDDIGVVPDEMDEVTERFLSAIEKHDADPLDAYVEVTRSLVPVVEDLVSQSSKSIAIAGAKVDPNTPTYGALESLPKSMRMSVRTWLGRELVRGRFVR